MLGHRQTPQSAERLFAYRPQRRCEESAINQVLPYIVGFVAATHEWRVSNQVLALQRCGGVGWKHLELPLDDLPKPVTQQAGWQEGDLQPL